MGNRKSVRAARVGAVSAVAVAYLFGADVPAQEHAVVSAALNACFKAARKNKWLGIQTIPMNKLLTALESFTKKHGSAFGTGKYGWRGQVSRWLGGGAFENYVMTPMGIALRSEINSLQEKNPRAQYITRTLRYLKAPQETPAAQKPGVKNTRPKKPAMSLANAA